MKLCTVSHFCLCRFTIHVLQNRHEKRTHLDAFPFPIRKVQADGGTEFAKRFTKGSEHDETRSWKQLREYGIEHQKIRPCTPRHNGKVERSHRKDNEAFDASHKFDSFADFKRQLARRNRICNAFPMRPLGWDSPNRCLKKYLAQCNIGLTNLQREKVGHPLPESY